MPHPKTVRTLHERLKIIEEVEKNPGVKRVDIAKRLGLAVSTLNSIFSKKDEVREQIQKCGLKSNKRKSWREPTYVELERILLEWYHQAKASDMPVNGNLLRENAKKIANQLNIQNFNASNGWISRFKDRNNLVYKKSVEIQSIQVWLQKLPSLLDGYEPRDIYNADEFGLFYNILPNKIFLLKEESCRGGQRSKERLTVLLCVNSDGSDKQVPFIIGQSPNPHCFNNIKKLPATYQANDKSWMTTDIFSSFLLALDANMFAQNRHVLLFVNNCVVHTLDTSFLRNVKVVRYPTDCPSPFDLGIIKFFKQFYRRHLVQMAVCLMDAGRDKIEKIDVLEAMHFITASWCQVTPQKIEDCFRNAGYFHGQSLSNINILTSNKNPDEAFQNDWLKFSGMSIENFDDYVSVDNFLVTSGGGSVEELCVIHVEAFNVKEEQEEEMEDREVNIPDFAEAHEALMKVKSFFYAQSNSESDCDSVLSLERSFFELRSKIFTEQLANTKVFCVKNEPVE